MIGLTRSVIVQDIILAIVINTSATILSGQQFHAASWYVYTCAAFGTNVLMQLIIPVAMISSWWTTRMKRGFAKTATVVFIENLLFVTGISAVMALTHGSVGPHFLPAWLSTYGQLVTVGYVTSMILALTAARLDRMKGDVLPTTDEPRTVAAEARATVDLPVGASVGNRAEPRTMSTSARAIPRPTTDKHEKERTTHGREVPGIARSSGEDGSQTYCVS